MNRIKTYLLLGFGASLFIAANAHAGVTTVVSVVSYAREATTGGTILTIPTQTVTRTMGVVRPSTADFFLKVSLGGGMVFGTLPTDGMLTLTTAAGGAATIKIVSGGASGDSSVTYLVDITTSFAGLPTFTFTTTGLNVRDTANTIGSGGTATITLSTTEASTGISFDVGTDTVNWLTGGFGIGDAIVTATTAQVDVSSGRLNLVATPPDTLTNDNGAALSLPLADPSVVKADGTPFALSSSDSILLILSGPLSGIFSWTWNPEAGGGGTAVTHLVTDEEIAAGQSSLTITGAANLGTIGTGSRGMQITVSGLSQLTSRTLRLGVIISTSTGSRIAADGALLTTWSLNGSVLVANWVNGNTTTVTSNVYVWNPSVTAGEINLRLFSLPTGSTIASTLIGTRSLGFLKPTSGLNIRLKEDVLQPLGLPDPLTDNGGNLVLEVSIEAVGCSGYAQTVGTSNKIVFGTTPLSVVK